MQALLIVMWLTRFWRSTVTFACVSRSLVKYVTQKTMLTNISRDRSWHTSIQRPFVYTVYIRYIHTVYIYKAWH
jgi:hypothetical protein